ncbi:DNA repair helicase XPB [Anaerobacillus isosaccharinicus]|uniref:DNA 3'-5' helicase n=1 Tax=Anaerobacillus isosaccharinicus TaxID=1532552 RepID=A0A1S2M810_9BACI|nr:DNA repair helicase XPB [Anaerobacillus isosaccharinicus]MBA5587467.1 DEAD/DEAH box helicase [Anaerobacillus isosaccharinicus]QOY34349.1 DEAD/DEAH box helicase [Anaerobacillus isosaccharinicus]
MLFNFENPLVVQKDGTIIVEANHKQFPIIQPMLSQMAILEKATLSTHTYKLSPYSIWSAQSQGIQVTEIINFLDEYCKYPLAQSVVQYVEEHYQRANSIIMEKINGECLLIFKDEGAKQTLLKDKKINKLLEKGKDQWCFQEVSRGELKRLCLTYGYFINDRIGYEKGQQLKIQMLANVNLRPYQKEAIKEFHKNGKTMGGNGIVVMPCGSGKTIVGLGIMEKVKEEVLIITSSETSMKQWQREIAEKTTVPLENVGLYSSSLKEVKPITIASYQMMIYRDHNTKQFIHLPLFNERNWGLIIYDEVHLLPAPIFKTTAGIQGKKRLGLTATLVREDGKQEEVYSLIGPKQYEVSWKGLENNGWIAKTFCKEIRINFSERELKQYVESNQQQQFKIASVNPTKIEVIKKLLQKHEQQPTLIIGQYIDQLAEVAEKLQLPMITGKTPQKERELLYEKFRQGEIGVLVVSKVANFAVDLPDAEVAIQISGAFGSRQEEAQRVGRVLRPKQDKNEAFFYSIVTRNTKEEHCSSHRQLFMLEQGYSYEVEEWLS